MSKRTIRFLLIIFIFLLGAAVYPYIENTFQNLLAKKTSTDSLFNEFSSENSQSIVIKKDREELTMTKQDNSWKVNSYPVSQKNLDDFFVSLKTDQIRQKVSKNKENHLQFEVTEEMGTQLSLKNSTIEKHFIIGKSGPNQNSYYLRVKDSDIVYLIQGTLREKLSTSIIKWRDKTVVNLDKNKLARIKISAKNGLILQKNKDGKWLIETTEKSKFLEENELTTVFTDLSPLEGYDFLTEKELETFEDRKEKTKIVFEEEDGKKTAELTVISQNGDYWLKESTKKELFKVYGYKLNNLLNIYDKLK